MLNKKIIGIALLLGLFTNLLVLAAPSPIQVSWYNGYDAPSIDNSFISGEQNLCVGVNFPYRLSKLRVGFPIRFNIVVDYDGCTGPINKFDTAVSVIPKSVAVWQFYLNWFLWSLLYFELGLIVKKMYKNK